MMQAMGVLGFGLGEWRADAMVIAGDRARRGSWLSGWTRLAIQLWYAQTWLGYCLMGRRQRNRLQGEGSQPGVGERGRSNGVGNGYYDGLSPTSLRSRERPFVVRFVGGRRTVLYYCTVGPGN